MHAVLVITILYFSTSTSIPNTGFLQGLVQISIPKNTSHRLSLFLHDGSWGLEERAGGRWKSRGLFVQNKCLTQSHKAQRMSQLGSEIKQGNCPYPCKHALTCLYDVSLFFLLPAFIIRRINPCFNRGGKLSLFFLPILNIPMSGMMSSFFLLVALAAALARPRTGAMSRCTEGLFSFLDMAINYT